MPTRPSTSLPEIRSDAAPLAPDLPVTSGKNVLATGLRHALRLLMRCWHPFEKERQRHRLRMALLGLTERELKDIGITGADIGYIAAYRNIERLRTGANDPWTR